MSDIMNDSFSEAIKIMQENFKKAVDEAKAEDAEEIKKAAKGFSDAVKLLVTSTDNKTKQDAYYLIELYKATLSHYKTIEIIRGVDTAIDTGIQIGLSIALKSAMIALL